MINLIVRENVIQVEAFTPENVLEYEGRTDIFKKALFFDLEHYVYKKPICVGVFGCCYYDQDRNALAVTQYMIENDNDARKILDLARDYFARAKDELGKEYIVTFSGNNDFTVINYLINKYKVDCTLSDDFVHMDLQKEYEKATGTSIGLKNLEKMFGISREAELISGQNLAKTFGKVMKDKDYINRMPEEKKSKILLYNEQDVVSLFHIYVKWNDAIERVKKEIEEKKKAEAEEPQDEH